MRKAAFLLFLLTSHAMADVAVFNSGASTLTIPTLQIGTTYYSDTKLLLPPSGQWSVVSVGTASSVSTASTPAALSCTASTIALSISPAAINAGPGEQVRFGIGGGKPPYLVISSRPTVATPVGSILQSCEYYAQALFNANSVGESEIIVYDALGNTASAKVNQSGLPVNAFSISPTSVTARTGETIKINIVGGWPPYQVSSSRSFVAWTESGTYNSVSPPGSADSAEATIHTRSQGVATITVSDAGGGQLSVTVTVE